MLFSKRLQASLISVFLSSLLCPLSLSPPHLPFHLLPPRLLGVHIIFINILPVWDGGKERVEGWSGRRSGGF